MGRVAPGIVSGHAERKSPSRGLHAGNGKPGTHEATSLGQKQGIVTLESFKVEISLQQIANHVPHLKVTWNQDSQSFGRRYPSAVAHRKISIEAVPIVFI